MISVGKVVIPAQAGIQRKNWASADLGCATHDLCAGFPTTEDGFGNDIPTKII